MRYIIKSLFTISVFLLSLSAFGQNGWYQQYSGTTNALNSVYFHNYNTGYMTGSNVTIKTENGGNNWYIISNSIGGTDVVFVNANTGFVAKENIFRTSNGGQNWTNIGLQNVSSLCFASEMVGYAVGNMSQVYRTDDAGLIWREQNVNFPYYKLTSVNFINESTGFTVGGMMYIPIAGIILKTNNGGANWSVINTESQDVMFRSVYFPTENVGYIVGSYELGSSGVIYKTTDGGSSWIQQGVTNKDLYAVEFVNAETGYAVGEDGFVIRTVNGGTIWNTQSANTNNNLRDITFVRDYIGYFTGDGGEVQKTVNGGQQGPPFTITGRVFYSDNAQPVTGGQVKALKYILATNSIVTVDSARIQSNGTYMLPRIPANDTVDIMVYQNDEEDAMLLHGFVPTYYGNTVNWTNATKIVASGNLNNVNINAFRLDSTGSAYHIGGGVYSNGSNGLFKAYVYAKVGNVFKGYARSLSSGLYEIPSLPPFTYTMIADRMGYFGATRTVTNGNYNLDTINFYLNPRYPIGIQNNGSAVPSAFRLGQNYPNPFNPMTYFDFDLPKDAFVSINVFDILGRKVETLIDKQMKAGSYKVDWDASKLSSGMYFYRIDTKDFSETKKMILIK